MNDIIEPLRDWGTRDSVESKTIKNLLLAAADEVETLQSEISDLKRTIRAHEDSNDLAKLHEISQRLINCLEWAMEDRDMPEDMLDIIELYDEEYLKFRQQRTATEKYLADQFKDPEVRKAYYKSKYGKLNSDEVLS